MHLCTTTCPVLILEHHQLIRILPGAAPAAICSQATALAENKNIESERAYNLRSKKLFGLVRRHVTDPASLQEIDTNAIIGNGRAAWAILQGHGQPPCTGLTNIDDNSKWSSLHASPTSASISAQIFAKINQINLEREPTSQPNENERRLKFLSMISYPAHLATNAQKKLQRPSYNNSNVPSLPLTVKAFDKLWRPSRFSQQHDPPPKSAASLSWWPSR
eukprot:3130398-Pleurochrysis_carterae.AAC.2